MKMLKQIKTPISLGAWLIIYQYCFLDYSFYFAIPSFTGLGAWKTKPTLFAENLNIDMAKAGRCPPSLLPPHLLSVSSSENIIRQMVQKNLRGRIYTSAIGLGLTIPALLFIGFGHFLLAVIGAAFCFGFGFECLMPTTCRYSVNLFQKIQGHCLRADEYGGCFCRSFYYRFARQINWCRKPGKDFCHATGIVAVALIIQLSFSET